MAGHRTFWLLTFSQMLQMTRIKLLKACFPHCKLHQISPWFCHLSVIFSYHVYTEPRELYILHNTRILTMCYRQPISYVRESVSDSMWYIRYTCSQSGVIILNVHKLNVKVIIMRQGIYSTDSLR